MNKQLLLMKRPVEFPSEDTWAFTEEQTPEPREGQLLIRQHLISLDPAMRGWINASRSYIEAVELGDVMRAGTVGQVVKAVNHPKFKEGDMLSGWGGVQQFTLTDGKGFHKINTELADPKVHMSTLGMPGMTAYFGILEVGKIKPGDTVVVSGAAGAVGSVVGQIAKIKGCRVVGIAGGEEKCYYLKEDLGFDEVIDYKSGNLRKDLKKACPEGIDVYFDNVGGYTLDTVLTRINRQARIVICGAISQYNEKAIQGPTNYLSLLVNRATMEGMVVFDYAKRYPEAVVQLAQWMKEGKLKSREDVYVGIEHFYETFCRLFSGEKIGKLILDIKH